MENGKSNAIFYVVEEFAFIQGLGRSYIGFGPYYNKKIR